jgi:hypothetical protein
MNEIIFMAHEPPEDGYTAETLGHSSFTGADSLEELNEMAKGPRALPFRRSFAPQNHSPSLRLRRSNRCMKLPRDPLGDDLVRALTRLGYQETRQTGSHLRLTAFEDGEHHVTIPRK